MLMIDGEYGALHIPKWFSLFAWNALLPLLDDEASTASWEPAPNLVVIRLAQKRGYAYPGRSRLDRGRIDVSKGSAQGNK